MLRARGVRLFLLAVLALLACAPVAAACAPDSGRNFSGRRVTSAELSIQASLECADFERADLRGVSFGQDDLTSADFRFANVTGDDFTQATLVQANFYGAQADHAGFGQATMQNATLNHAQLQDADFTQAHLEYATFAGSDTSGADFTQAYTYGTTGLPSSPVALIALIVLGSLIAIPVLLMLFRRTRTATMSPRTVAIQSSRSVRTSRPPVQRPVAPPPADPVPPQSDEVAQLEQVTALHKSGALTDEEFQAAKQKIIDAG